MRVRLLTVLLNCVLIASRSFGAPGDTTVIVNSGPGVLETTINGDVANNVRNNPKQGVPAAKKSNLCSECADRCDQPYRHVDDCG